MATKSVASTGSSRSGEAAAVEPLYQVKLLAALRSGDPALIHPFLTEISKDKQKSTGSVNVDTGAAALHLAIRCASLDTVSLLLSHRAISPNGVHPVGSGTTPLHLAASLGRADIVNLLLEQERIDDTLRDSQKRTCKDVAKSKDVLRAIEDSRSFLNASYRSLLHTYAQSPPGSPPPTELIALLESPRVRWVKMSYLDDTTGQSLLHEAARRKDLRLIELAVRAGADVFVRDRKGKTAYECAPKDDQTRVFLRQFANQDNSLIDTPASEPPVLRGYLQKYANVARGYGARWFVLKGGVLSYYRHQEDETVASRGSISMKNAILKVAPGGDNQRFIVHSTPSRAHSTSGVQKWYIKANHRVEASRWTQAIAKSIEWHRRDSPGASDKDSRRSEESEREAAGTGGTPKLGGLRGSLHRVSHSGSGSLLRRRAGTSVSSLGEGQPVDEDEPGGRRAVLGVDEINGEPEELEQDAEDMSSDQEPIDQVPPHEDEFELQGNSVVTALDLTSQLLAGLGAPSQSTAPLQESLVAAQSMFNEYVRMSRAREDWWRGALKRERERQSVWEESLATVVREGEALERELRTRSRRRGSRFFDASLGGSEGGMGTIKQAPAGLPSMSESVAEEPAEPLAPSYFPSGADAKQLPAVVVEQPHDSVLTPKGLPPVSTAPVSIPTPSRSATEDTATLMDTDDEDEFFDAIESNTLPNLHVDSALQSPAHAESELPPGVDLAPFAGYKHLRERLAISSDDRPSTSLWSVLKHSIGKDLTKISFPVFFNEPTSMLQRMAEDMEFSECLDAACKQQDPQLRIAYVAAFAMSNYSSTIGRIAKPFNPMLGETFEYVRLDKEYRYYSEQVSHHPPISACWAESPQYRYFGEVDAQNKFMGKSFEIRPTGVAHSELFIPEEWGPDYPKAEGKMRAGKVVEHFSWKKVTTNVSGFILGAPSIDHYGTMTVTNHRTQDTCILTFKPRGWRGKDAFEISGEVRDSAGIVTHEIAGRWNSQLIARAVGTGSGFLHPDAPVSGPTSPSMDREYILLWRNTDKPPAPFNLTPFAITLNDCPKDTLKPYICPTDCRLRPDQRAFELGKYELANALKNEQEEKQRATRRAREEGKLPPHRPRWFSAVTDENGERLWIPSRTAAGALEYWAERDRVYKEGGREKSAWKDVEPIFIDEPDVIKSA